METRETRPSLGIAGARSRRGTVTRAALEFGRPEPAAGEQVSPRRGYADGEMSALSMGAALARVAHQQYLLEVRQMQALSFSVQIPLVAVLRPKNT